MKSLIIFLYFFEYVRSLDVIVKVKHGRLLGKEHTLSNGRTIYAFLGIPYAAPPILDNRFQDPKQLKSRDDIIDATFARSNCVQVQLFSDEGFSGNEDCLYLNVYTTKLSPTKKNELLDVLVYIHGGGYTSGSGNLFPDRILNKKDIIFVAMNYRLGAFGFLSTEDNTVPGNMGLKDQTAALRWIKKNIIFFGGNPKSVTIAGHSAGAVCVHYHLFSPLSKGLFHKAISFSGALLTPWSQPTGVHQKSNNLAISVECPYENTKLMVDCLRNKSVPEIMRAYQSMTSGRINPIFFGPTVEPKIPGAFLFKRPIDIWNTKIPNDVPWLISTVRNEGLILTVAFIKSDSRLKKINDQWNRIAPELLDYEYGLTETEKLKISTAVKKFYFGEKPISRETIKELLQLIDDRIMYIPLFEAIERHNLATKNNIYCLKFNYRGERSFTNRLANDTEDYGISHGDDLQYYIKSYPQDNLRTESDLEVSELMASLITDFMSLGHPSKNITEWKPLKKETNFDMNCLHIYSSKQMEMKNIQANLSTKKFWEDTLPFE